MIKNNYSSFIVYQFWFINANNERQSL